MLCQKTRQRVNDGSTDDKEYGTVENRRMVRLNGLPLGYKNNNSFLVHSLQYLYGMNYSRSFYTKTTNFTLILNVQEKLIDGSHDEAL